MKTFSIAELEQYTLIKAHTFRTWELRYDVFKSRRSATNLRFYTLEDLAFLLGFSLLNRLGNRVSTLASLNRAQITNRISQLKDSSARQQHRINQLIMCTFSLDFELFERLLNEAVEEWGIGQTIDEVILPLMERLALFSFKGRTSIEYHFVVTVIRQKMMLGIERAQPQQSQSESVVLYLPEGEHFDLLLLYVYYNLQKAGFKTLYFGTDVSAKNIQAVVKKTQPHLAVMYVYGNKNQTVKKIADYLPERDAVTTLIATPGTFLSTVSPSPLARARFVDYKHVVAEAMKQFS
ncbi:MAG TPA: hypothetical protein VER36_07405 [Flavisolibacter sp.]|nr:hypothetical protein [Flavisolibacter sp.]